MAIITVSRQLYSLGDEIAKKVADDLGYEFIDKQKVEHALAGLGLPATEMDRYDEKKPSIWDSLVIQQNKFLYLIRAAIYDFAEKNDTIILGRGAQILLKDLPGTLHVRIVAPMEVRVKRIMAQAGYDEKNGERVLRQSDRDSSGYIRSFFSADWNDQHHYDMVINTKTISIDTAAGMMESVIRSAEFESNTEARSGKLADLSLHQKAEAAIMEIHRGNTLFVTVTTVDKGVVTLKGTTDSTTIKKDCELAIANINGVRRVKNEISVIKTVYG